MADAHVLAEFYQKSEVCGVRAAHIICIVDDDEAVCIATSALVRSLGWPASVFSSAEEFLQFAHIAETACLICDVRMPHMSGVEMHDRLLQLGYAPPTIFVTAYPTPALRARVMANGALALLEKPVDVVAIEHYLTLVMGRP